MALRPPSQARHPHHTHRQAHTPKTHAMQPKLVSKQHGRVWPAGASLHQCYFLLYSGFWLPHGSPRTSRNLKYRALMIGGVYCRWQGAHLPRDSVTRLCVFLGLLHNEQGWRPGQTTNNPPPPTHTYTQVRKARGRQSKKKKAPSVGDEQGGRWGAGEQEKGEQPCPGGGRQGQA